MQKKSYYIAYGSNMNVSQMEKRCPSAKIYGVGELQDYKLIFKAQKVNSYATIEADKGNFVPIVLWTIEEQDEIRLDEYENYPTLYSKIELMVLVNGENIKGMVYVMNEECRAAIPTKKYFESILAGYQYFGLDETLLYKAMFQKDYKK